VTGVAGYFLYSLNWSKLESFLEAPDEKNLLKMANIVSDGLDRFDDEIDDDDPLADWPSEPKELVDILKQRIGLEDWYCDLSDPGRRIWEAAIEGLCSNDKSFGFRVDSDGVYWDIVDIAKKFHCPKAKGMTTTEVTHFGTRPLRYWNEKPIRWEDWYPYHSMHTPDEVTALRDQFQAAETTILKSKIEGVKEDYEELMPVLDSLSNKKRMLYVCVDT